MKRVKKAFAAGSRVYAAGAELPDTHPAVKASPGLFESVPAQAKQPRRGKSAKAKAEPDEKKEGDGQEPKEPAENDGQEAKDEADADGDS